MYLLISWKDKEGFSWKETESEAVARLHPKLSYHFVFWREHNKRAIEVIF